MHDMETRRRAVAMLEAGISRREVTRTLGVSYNSTYRWQTRLEPDPSMPQCFRCNGVRPHPKYTYLLGQYLGDGHIGRSGRTIALRIFCCDHYPLIITEVASAMVSVSNTAVNFRQLDGCTQVQSATKHWRCTLPQLGPGMKHTRPIVLAPWQQELIENDPRPLLRGLIQSDGCRALNTVHRNLPSGRRTYDYPRYFFSNMSDDIRGIFTDALDLLGIAWRQNRFNSISIARADAVVALDEFVGPKS
jgi:hypothetical protein